MTLVETIVVIVVIGFLCLLLLPALISRHDGTQHTYCVNNLKEDYLAFKIWEGDNGDKFPMAVSTSEGGALEYAQRDEVYRYFQVASNQVATPKILVCPTDVRHWATDWISLQNSNISYFVNIDANESYPAMIVFGDRNVIGGTRLSDGLTVFNPTNSISWSSEMHNGSGNIALTDGSVAQTTSAGLSHAFADFTNGLDSSIDRYAFP